MKYLTTILVSMLGAVFAFADTWTIQFKDKTQNSITGYASGTDVPTVNSVTLSGATTQFKTSGGVAGNTALFTPNTNVQLEASDDGNPYVGAWTGTVALKATADQSISKIIVNLFTFDKDGNAQGSGTNRNLKLSASLNGTTVSKEFTINGTGSLNTLACEFTLNTPILLTADTVYELKIKAERANQTNGCYFGMESIAAEFVTVVAVESTTIPRGYVVKKLPAGKTFYFNANVQKPILTAGTGAFSVIENEVTLTADAGVDFAAELESGKAYLLEVDFDDGTAIAMINPESWIDGADAWTATGNVLIFSDSPLASLIAAAGESADALAWRIREAWTLDEVFGASYAAGELKQGSALTGDAIFLYATDMLTPIKFYNHASKGWNAVGVKATTAQPGNAPIHPHKPLRITRKKGTDLELNLIGEASVGDALIAVVDTVDVVASGDAFSQTLANSELANVLAVVIAETRYVFDVETQKWIPEDNSAVEDPSLDDVFETERSEASPGHVRVRSAR